ncbi:MAG TPA: DUF2905 domain-containing protein [Chitinophagaceae bacterium]|nr:DUF2905 domain-containing protein [Chitinophagaceae bacterium]
MKQAGKFAIGAGILLVILGIMMMAFGNRLRWVGKLPGDIRIRRPGFQIYMPLTTMILASVLLSLIWWIIRKIFS